MDDDSSSSKLQLCLTWNSFTDNIINSLESSYGDGDFVDVTLACEGESIKAHKLVLSACSQYLKRLLKENPCPHPIIILNDVGLAELKDLLAYMYHGEVRVEQDRIAKLLHTAQVLEIRGLRDINQKLDQDLDNGQAHDTSSLAEGVQNQDSGGEEYSCNQNTSASNNSYSFHDKLPNKTGTTVQMNASQKLPPAKKSRPVPMLQCIQPGKVDSNSALPEDRDDNEDESNASSAADHSTFMEDIRVKEEKPDMVEDFDKFTPNQSSNHDNNSSDGEQQQFNNGFSGTSGVTLSGGSMSASHLAAEMLKRVASRATSGEQLSLRETPSQSSSAVGAGMTDQGISSRVQKDTGLDEVTVSLLNSSYKRKRAASASLLTEVNEQNDAVDFRSWSTHFLDNRSNYSSSDRSPEVIEIMDTDTMSFSRRDSFHQKNELQNYIDSRHGDDGEYMRSLEGKMSLRYLDIENMLNINPQLRLQMLMCREYKKYTNILLVAMFGRDMLATHSLNGTGTSKPRLDTQKVNHIIEAVMTKFGVDQHHVKEAIRIKLNNEDKLKKRLTQKVSSSIVGMQ